MQHRSQFQLFRDVASLINASSDLDEILRKLVYAACLHGGWTMGAIMAIDQKGGYAHVIARYDPNLLEPDLENRWRLSVSPALIALTHNEPVIIRDAQVAEAFPGYQREALEHGYKTVVVLPIGRADLQGRALTLSLKSRSIVDVTGDHLAILDTIIHLGSIAIDNAHRLRTEIAIAERLRSTLDAHSLLMRRVLGDGSVQLAAAMIEDLLNTPTVVVDLNSSLIVTGRSPRPELIDADSWRSVVRGDFARQLVREARAIAGASAENERSLVLPHKGANLQLSARIEPLFVDQEPVGALIVFAEISGFSAIDPLLLESVKFALSVQLMRGHIRFRNESQTLSELFTDIAEHRWRDPNDITTRARRLGVDLSVPAHLIAIEIPDRAGVPTEPPAEFHRSIIQVMGLYSADATVAIVGTLIVCRIPTEAMKRGGALKALVQKITEEARFACDEAPMVALSKVCEVLEDHPSAWEECRRVLRLAKRFNRRGMVTAHDFGPFPALLSSSDSREVQAFIDGLIGPILRHDSAHGAAYLATLSSFLSTGCRHQACADALGVHVTTLRYRLTRLHDLFGIEIDTPHRRFAVELALRLHEALAEQAQD